LETIAMTGAFMSLSVEVRTCVGSAGVVEIADDRVLLTFLDRQIWAVMALAYPYQPKEGDLVLTIGQEDDWYVIGVLKGRGESVFKAPGDLKFLAPNGKIELLAGKQVKIRGSAVQVAADRIELLAHTIHERFLNAYRWVQGVFALRVGHAQIHVQETYRVKAGRIVERAEGDVHIDGRKIHLG
jgi:Protein of unknown function (DUF3540)